MMKQKALLLLISKFPKKIAKSNETSSYGSYFEIKEWGEVQTGWDFGEDRDLIGKVNRIIEWINNFEKMKEEKRR